MGVPAYTLGWLRCFELTSQNLQLGFTLEEKKGHQQTHHGLVGGEEFLAGTGDEELIALCIVEKALNVMPTCWSSNSHKIGPTIVQPLHDPRTQKKSKTYKTDFECSHHPEISRQF